MNVGIDGPSYIKQQYFEQLYADQIRIYTLCADNEFHLFDHTNFGRLASAYLLKHYPEHKIRLYSSEMGVDKSLFFFHDADPTVVRDRWRSNVSVVVQHWPILHPLSSTCFLSSSTVSTNTLRYVTATAFDSVINDISHDMVVLPPDVLQQIGQILEEYTIRKQFLTHPPANEIDDIEFTPPQDVAANGSDDDTIEDSAYLPTDSLCSDDSRNNDATALVDDGIAQRTKKRSRQIPNADYICEANVVENANAAPLSLTNTRLESNDIDEFYSCISRPHELWPETAFYRRHISMLRQLFVEMGRPSRAGLLRELFLLAAENRLLLLASVRTSRVGCWVCGKTSAPVYGTLQIAFPLTALHAKTFPTVRREMDKLHAARLGAFVVARTCFDRLKACVDAFLVINAARRMYLRYKGGDQDNSAQDWVHIYLSSFYETMKTAQTACALHEQHNND